MTIAPPEIRHQLAEVMPDVVEIHVSDIAMFKACRRQWNWASRIRHNLEPKRPYHAFFTGRAIHHCLERFHYFGEDWETSLAVFLQRELEVIKGSGAIWAQEEKMITEQIALIETMLPHYFAWEKRQQGPFSLKNLEFMTVEQDFRLPIVHPITGEVMRHAVFAGKWDGLVRRRDNGDIYIWELKTAKALSQRARLLLNEEQPTQYLNAARTIFGEDVKGVVYTLMAKRTPVPVRVLNSGYLSGDIRNQSFDSYLMQIRNYHGDEATNDFIAFHYGAQLLALHESTETGNVFHERHVVNRTEHALWIGKLDLWDVTVAMTDPQTPLYPTAGFHCGYCQYRDPCIALQNGTNFQMLLEDNYRLRPQHAGESDADE